MIDISTINRYNKSDIKDLKPLSKIEGIVLYCDPGLFEYEEKTTYTKEATDKDFLESVPFDKGYHVIVDEKNIVIRVPLNKQTEHLRAGNLTYIERALYQGKTNEKTISILMLVPNKHKYPEIEKKTIKFIANLLIKNELTIDCLMRGFDLNRVGSPLHLLEKDKWSLFIKTIEKTYENMKKYQDKDNEKDSKNKDDKEYNDDILIDSDPTYKDKEIKEFYLEHGQKADEYTKNYEPDHRDIKKITDFKSNEAGEIKTFETKNKTNFTYTVVENIPSSADHCNRSFDTVTAKVQPNTLEVEPIYPDLAVPPGGTLTISNNITATTNTVPSSTTLSPDDFEKRQQSFNVNDFKDAVKEISGKPVNNNDPYPTDDKIKELESHMPKVKIDEVNFKLHDCNHPGSIIGPEVSKNFAMVQDEMITIAKRTERRLVRLENILATVTRNLFRTSARMHINCVYYGGQDVYGKYKNIRCLHGDRVNDGQSMTLDQCLSCTRYEPIIGQVYAILDDSGTNIAQVLDDIQMSYMSLTEYSDFTRTDIHTAREMANLKVDSNEPPKFSDIWEEGFKMDWNTTPLEAQRPNIAEYKTEGIEAIKPIIEKPNEGTVESEFKDTLGDTESYETLVFNSDDYKFEGFGDSNTNLGAIGNGSFGMGATEIRNKIIEYAENALKLCQEGKAGYSQNSRYAHLDDAIDGISYWDCSSLVQGAYEAAGITGIGTYTGNQYPFNLPNTGGIIFSIDDEDKAIPGDMVWFTTQSPKPKTDTELAAANVGLIGHVGIYIGNGEYIHASTDEVPLTEQIKKSPTKNWDSRIFAIGRPKALVEADEKAAALGALGEGFFNYESHQFNSTITDLATKHLAGQVDSTMQSVKKYGYGPALIKICNKYELDPYLILGLIATESAGDPADRSGSFWGIMQTSSEFTKATENLSDIIADIEYGCSHFITIRSYLRKDRQNNLVLAVYAYNAGNGTIDSACDNYGPGAETVMGGPFAQYAADEAVRRFGAYKQDEVSSYLAKVILRANELRARNALG